MKKNLIVLATLFLSVSLMAQQSGGRPPQMKSPEEIAQKKADQMKAEVNLTDKQYKKVYNLIKKDHQYRQEQMQNQFGGGMPPQGGGPGGFGGGMPPQGGGFDGGMGGFGGGMPPQGGGQGGFGGGMPPQGGGQGMGGPGGPGGPGPGMGKPAEVSDEYLEKQDKKLKKILTEEQYDKWRSKHPAEYLELPPIEFN